jgi:hypothetical protein
LAEGSTAKAKSNRRFKDGQSGGVFRKALRSLTAVFINLKDLTEFIERQYIFTMFQATPAQPTAVRTGFIPQTHRQFRAAELTTDPATGNRQQATGNRQQATGNRQQATGKYGSLIVLVNPLTA